MAGGDRARAVELTYSACPLPSRPQRLSIQPVERRVMPLRGRVIVNIGVVDRIAVLRAVLLNLVANVSCVELGAQLGFSLRREVADGGRKIDLRLDCFRAQVWAGRPVGH